MYLSANGAECEKNVNKFSLLSSLWCIKSLTPLCSDHPAEKKMCESRCSLVTIPYKHQINKVVIHERYQAAFNKVFRYQEQTVPCVRLCPQCCLKDSKKRRNDPSAILSSWSRTVFVHGFPQEMEEDREYFFSNTKNELSYSTFMSFFYYNELNWL